MRFDEDYFRRTVELIGYRRSLEELILKDAIVDRILDFPINQTWNRLDLKRFYMKLQNYDEACIKEVQQDNFCDFVSLQKNLQYLYFCASIKPGPTSKMYKLHITHFNMPLTEFKVIIESEESSYDQLTTTYTVSQLLQLNPIQSVTKMKATVWDQSSPELMRQAIRFAVKKFPNLKTLQLKSYFDDECKHIYQRLNQLAKLESLKIYEVSCQQLPSLRVPSLRHLILDIKIDTEINCDRLTKCLKFHTNLENVSLNFNFEGSVSFVQENVEESDWIILQLCRSAMKNMKRLDISFRK